MYEKVFKILIWYMHLSQGQVVVSVSWRVLCVSVVDESPYVLLGVFIGARAYFGNSHR